MMKELLDGGDLDTTLRKHRARKRWLVDAEEWLKSDRQTISLTAYDIRNDGPKFVFDMPRSMWEPQLRARAEEIRIQVAELDKIVRSYVEAALKE